MNAVATPVDKQPEELTIHSKLLGELVAPANQVFTFNEGLLGFPEARDFALLAAGRDGFFWLQCLDFEALTFLLIDPFRFVEGYSVDLGPQELGDLMPRSAGEILVLSIVTLPKTPEDVTTANLQGPVALNVAQNRGKQVVFQESAFGIRYPVDLKKRKEASAET